MLKTKIWAHGPSDGALELSRSITTHGIGNTERGLERVASLKLATETRWNYQRNNFIINWGNSNTHSIPPGTDINFVINPPALTSNVSNKDSFFSLAGKQNTSRISRRNLLQTTSRRQVAEEWFLRGATVVERHTLRGHSGDGIRIKGHSINEDIGIETAPLYTKYINKSEEYRVHFIRTSKANEEYKFFIQQKKRNYDVAEPDWRVRSHQNGFVYTSNHNLGIQSVGTLRTMVSSLNRDFNLDFGAVDIIKANNSDYNRTHCPTQAERYVVLEINTAPGLASEVSTNFYGENLTSLIRNRKNELER